MAIQNYVVIAGPSKFDLMLSLFTGTMVTFTLGKVGEWSAEVTELGVLCGSSKHENFCMKGFLKRGSAVAPFEGYFDIRIRRGQISFSPTCFGIYQDGIVGQG